MKKVKIMLLSIALLAIVGGALAFKAKFDATFCTMDPIVFTDPTTAPDDACPLIVNIETTTIGGVAAFVDETPVNVTTLPGHGTQLYCNPDDCVVLKLVQQD